MRNYSSASLDSAYEGWGVHNTQDGPIYHYMKGGEWEFAVYHTDTYRCPAWRRSPALRNANGWVYHMSGNTIVELMPNATTEEEAMAVALAMWRME
jgi:hypothetical protein